MRRRPVARVTTGVAVATVALTSVFAGTAWAPKIKTLPADPPTAEECLAEPKGNRPPGYVLEHYSTLKECLADAKAALKQAAKDSRQAD